MIGLGGEVECLLDRVGHVVVVVVVVVLTTICMAQP